MGQSCTISEINCNIWRKTPTFSTQYLELLLSVNGENFQQKARSRMMGLNRWMNNVDDNVQPFRHNSLYSIMHFVAKRPSKYRERSWFPCSTQ